MRSISIALCFATDAYQTTSDAFLRRHLDQQLVAIQKFFAPTPLDLRDHIRHSTPNLPICSWLGIKCDPFGVVKSIEYKHIRRTAHYLFNFDWIPATVTRIDFERNKHTGTISTRRLPKMLELLNISQNQFSGEFAMHTLPRHLREMNIQNNRFHTFHALMNLPESIKAIELSWDDCREKTLWYDALPESLIRVYVWGISLKRIKGVKECSDRHSEIFTDKMIWDPECPVQHRALVERLSC